MIVCQLCGYPQPDGVKECLQCHTPITARARRFDEGSVEHASSGRSDRRPARAREQSESGGSSRESSQSASQGSAPRIAVDAPPASSQAPATAPQGAGVTQLVEKLGQVIITTTPEIHGRTAIEYRGVVTAGAVVKLDGFDFYIENVREVGALRSAPFFEQMRKARDIAMTDLKIEAAKLGANGVVGVAFQYEQSQRPNQPALLIWIVATGTAVVLAE